MFLNRKEGAQKPGWEEGKNLEKKFFLNFQGGLNPQGRYGSRPRSVGVGNAGRPGSSTALGPGPRKGRGVCGGDSGQGASVEAGSCLGPQGLHPPNRTKAAEQTERGCWLSDPFSDPRHGPTSPHSRPLVCAGSTRKFAYWLKFMLTPKPTHRVLLWSFTDTHTPW